MENFHLKLLTETRAPFFLKTYKKILKTIMAPNVKYYPKEIPEDYD